VRAPKTTSESLYAVFNRLATKKIKDRGIHWQESYHEKSAKMKEKFDGLVGPKAYLRWEGHDSYSGHDYYVVIGPSVQDNEKLFFAGIKKMPRDENAKVYSPYGEYFPTIKMAMSYASKKWGVPFMQGLPEYTKETLAPVEIPEHIKG
jgi:hypothetical protein